MSGTGSNSGAANSAATTEKPDKESLWYFNADQLASSPSRRHGIDSDQELSYRQMTAYLIQEMGQRLQVSQLCINTAIVYMHRFYAFHSFTHFHRNGIAAASLFLAAKVEEQPRKLEHVIKAANKCLNQPTTSTTDAYYIEQAQDLVFNENVLLQTLGFDVAIDHPHTHVVKTCHLVKACKDLAQTSYFLASNSLHLTSMCLQYKPTVVACFCIYLACKWSRWEIPQSTEGKHWFHYVDKTVTMDLLKQLTDEFIAIYEKSPARLKSKLNSIKALAQGASNRVINKDKKAPQEEWKMTDMMKVYHSSINTNDNNSNSGSASSFSSQTLTDPQHAPIQSVQASLNLANLPQSQQQQQPQHQHQIRIKSELHSSQHRTHHNSNSSHHHSKLGGFHSNDVTDHKSNHKQQQQQQQSFSGGLINRQRDQGQTQGHQLSSTGNNSRPLISVPSGVRSAPTGAGAQGGGVQRQSSNSQGHQLDINYHKSRSDRSNVPGAAHASSSSSSSSHAGQKMSQKQDSNRAMSKDMMSRSSAEQTKQIGAKMFSSSTSSSSSMGGGPPQYGNMNQLQGTSQQANTKIENIHDMQRNSINQNQQRAFASSNNSLAGVPPPLSYHQTQQLARQNAATIKHEQMKPISVHVQQQHKSLALPPESSMYAMAAHETQQTTSTQQQQQSCPPNMRPPNEALHVEDHHASMGQQSLMPQNYSQTQIKSSSSSLFSPDWNDKTQNPIVAGTNYNGSNATSIAPVDSYNSKVAAAIKESPKRLSEREITIKKEKNRNSHAAMDCTSSSSFADMRANNAQPNKSINSLKKSELNSNLGAELGNASSTKRSIESTNYKQEDDMQRDIKIRKLDSSSHMGDMSKLQVVNGMETNPDLVRSLLKESICTQSALIKTEPITAPSLYPPAELLQPTTVSTYKSGIADSRDSKQAAATATAATSDESMGGGKSEKKKKKEKHKHKEKDKDKDKSKDREERKKHKKEKDKRKDRESDSSEHVKIKISKEKLEGAAGSNDQMGFKIKIPKDRIISNSDISGNNASGNVGNASQRCITVVDPPLNSMNSLPAHTLKIKISKDKLENYSSGSTDVMNAAPNMSSSAQSSASYYSSFGMSNSFSSNTSGSSSSTTHNTKKKDRDKERDKEKRRSGGSSGGGHDVLKSNINMNLGTGMNCTPSLPAAAVHNVAAAAAAAAAATSKNHNSSKFKDLL